ncbi:protein of unknown function [Shewanella benthica]|uniref:Uncharacterized protein n=1 Tax=Shewanella benthica TaxID=43661 RepID=A0A330LW20_9GAMM|nr:protein of unknown function [Shewanella benthica]
MCSDPFILKVTAAFTPDYSSLRSKGVSQNPKNYLVKFLTKQSIELATTPLFGKGSESWCIGSDSSDPKSHIEDVVKTLYNQW